MKTLHDHIILYDAECPMCNLYTGAFVKNGLLDPTGREAYQHYPGNACPNLDWQRAVNEIALINRTTGEVTYGIESLLKISANAMPILRPLSEWKPFLWLAGKAYAFISYNRRVIVPAPVTALAFTFQPGFKIGYRIAWLVFAWLLTSYILASYVKLLTAALPAGVLGRELAICAGQIVFQGIIIAVYQKHKTWDYLGNMMTVSLAGAIVLLAFSSIEVWLHLGWFFYAFCFLLVVFLMFLEHIRRCQILGIGHLMSLTWVLYRVIILAILLNCLP